MKDISLYEKHAASPKNLVLFNCYSVVTTLLPHWHEYIEILFFYSGNFEFFCNGEAYNVEKNDMIVVNTAEIHSFTGTGDTKNHCILFHPSFFPNGCFDDVLIKTHIKNDEYIAECMHKIAFEAHNKPDGWEMMVNSLLYGLMTHLYRNYNETNKKHSHLPSSSVTLERLNQVLEHISTHYSEELTTTKLAEMCYLDPSYFCRFFKKTTGKSVITYINEYRIEKAAFYLETTDETITKIANAVGFNDTNYFCRIFKKIKNDTPAQYRKKLVKDKT